METEKEKYIDMYSGNAGMVFRSMHNEIYGSGNWGAGIAAYISSQKINSICDVGCGVGRFCNSMVQYIPKIYGVDIAAIVTNQVRRNDNIIFLDGEAKNIPLDDKQVEWITSFDCLEHCPKEDIDLIFKEFKRVATKGFIISVSSMEDQHYGKILHLTVEPQEWWYEKCKQYGTIELYGGTPETNVPYIICKFN